MKRIIKIGMDVHSTTFSLHCLEPDLLAKDHTLGTWKVAASAKNVLDVITSKQNIVYPKRPKSVHIVEKSLYNAELFWIYCHHKVYPKRRCE